MSACATIDSFDALMRTLRQDPNHQRVTDIHGRTDIAALCATAHDLWPDEPVLTTVQSFDHGDPRIAESGLRAIHVAALFAGRSLQLDIWALDHDNRVIGLAYNDLAGSRLDAMQHRHRLHELFGEVAAGTLGASVNPWKRSAVDSECRGRPCLHAGSNELTVMGLVLAQEALRRCLEQHRPGYYDRLCGRWMATHHLPAVHGPLIEVEQHLGDEVISALWMFDRQVMAALKGTSIAPGDLNPTSILDRDAVAQIHSLTGAQSVRLLAERGLDLADHGIGSRLPVWAIERVAALHAECEMGSILKGEPMRTAVPTRGKPVAWRHHYAGLGVPPAPMDQGVALAPPPARVRRSGIP